MREPFYVYARGPAAVCARIDGERVRIYECTNTDVAIEVCCAMNLVFQTLTYGLADTVAKEAFNEDYGDNGWCSEDIFELTTKMIELGLLPRDIENHSRALN